MRRKMTLGCALCSTLLLVLLAFAGRMLYVKFYDRSLADIAGKSAPAALTLTSGQYDRTIEDAQQIAAITDVLAACTYTPYPHLLRPSADELTAVRLTVGFPNGSSIGVDADGYVFVDGVLRAIDSGRGQELYHRLFVLFYPDTAG
ncbi:MAG: hypothetical protein Q4D31_06080 [Eubacteriales bacterium]|nr:hypothetical protein [Eubacteriales bacterium]